MDEVDQLDAGSWFDGSFAGESVSTLPEIPHGLLGRVTEADIPGYAEWADQINPSCTTVAAAYYSDVLAGGDRARGHQVQDGSDHNCNWEVR